MIMFHIWKTWSLQPSLCDLMVGMLKVEMKSEPRLEQMRIYSIFLAIQWFLCAVIFTSIVMFFGVFFVNYGCFFILLYLGFLYFSIVAHITSAWISKQCKAHPFNNTAGERSKRFLSLTACERQRAPAIAVTLCLQLSSYQRPQHPCTVSCAIEVDVCSAEGP